LSSRGDQQNETYRKACMTFSMKFQQFTSPVMAKGLEDTSFYRYHALMSINDVGGNPLEFGVTPEEFHAKTAIRAQNWPHSMLATSTHDSKLSEDVRARINVLSEIPGQWRLKVRQWRRLNQRKKFNLDGFEAPTRNDEYLFYQILIGVWPTGEDAPSDELRERLKNYMLKAAREAKEFTSWANQNHEYENALSSFIEGVLDSAISQEFISDLLSFQRWVASIGAMNSLSQTLIKLASPGTPDIYQGNELFEFRLVDPDNRRPVDYALRQKLLCELTSLLCSGYASTARTLTESVQKEGECTARAKLYLTWKALSARREYASVFQSAKYTPLTAEGATGEHVIAFARGAADLHIITVVPRLFAKLLGGRSSLLDPNIWQNSRIKLPLDLGATEYHNWMTGEKYVPARNEQGELFLEIPTIFKDFPWGLLIGGTNSSS